MDIFINVDPTVVEGEMAFSYEYENGRCVVYHFAGEAGVPKAARVAVAFAIAERTGCFSGAETLGRELADRVEVVS